MTATLYRTDGSMHVVEFPGGQGTLQLLHDCVGGYIEIVRVRAGTLIVNDDGLRLELPYNARASKLANAAIVGNAVLFAPGVFEALDRTLG